MNKENFKTLLLAFLVFISIYLVKGFWNNTLHVNSKGYDKDIVENIERSYKLEDVMIPEKTIISFDENDKTVIYSDNKYDVWNKGKIALEDIFNSKNIDNIVEQSVYDELQENRSVNFQFSQEMYTNMVGKILGIEIPKEIYQKMETISNIKFSIGKNSFLTFENDENQLIIKTDNSKLSNLENIVSQIKKSNYTKFYKSEEVLGVKSNVLIPVKSQNSISTVHINTKYNFNREINLNDTIAELFFYKKIEYIKKIEESNGSSIYIDGENILKIYKDGRLEYIGGMEEAGETDLYSSLKKSVDFISNHRGWPDNVYLSDIEDIEAEGDIKSYKFTFRYKTNGLTVYSKKNDIQDKIEVKVVDGRITSYKSRIWNTLGIVTRQEDSNTLSGFEIIDNNFTVLKNEFIKKSKEQVEEMTDEEINQEVKKAISDIYLAYNGDLSGDQEVLKPVWVIEMQGERYFFDAYNGRIKS